MTLYPPVAGGPQFTAGSAPHGNQATQDLNVLIQQPLAFLTAGIPARVHQGTAQNFGIGNNVVQFDTVDEDPYSGWNASGHWWACPAGCSGWYEISAAVSSNTGSSELRPYVAVTGNTSQIYALQDFNSPATPRITGGSVIVYLFGGVDYVQAWAYASTTATTIITAGQAPYMGVAWLSN